MNLNTTIYCDNTLRFELESSNINLNRINSTSTNYTVKLAFRVLIKKVCRA